MIINSALSQVYLSWFVWPSTLTCVTADHICLGWKLSRNDASSPGFTYVSQLIQTEDVVRHILIRTHFLWLPQILVMSNSHANTSEAELVVGQTQMLMGTIWSLQRIHTGAGSVSQHQLKSFHSSISLEQGRFITCSLFLTFVITSAKTVTWQPDVFILVQILEGLSPSRDIRVSLTKGESVGDWTSGALGQVQNTGEVLERYWEGTPEILGRIWGGTWEKLGRYWGGTGIVLGHRWRRISQPVSKGRNGGRKAHQELNGVSDGEGQRSEAKEAIWRHEDDGRPQRICIIKEALLW